MFWLNSDGENSKWLETDFEFRGFELIKIKKDSRKQKDKTSSQLPFPLSIFQFSAHKVLVREPKTWREILAACGSMDIYRSVSIKSIRF